jgi:hypothetical protein
VKPTTLSPFGDYVVFVDETGDHGMTNINRDFPLFGLAFCVFAKTDYIGCVTPALRRLKFATFGYDLVVLHEHDIRKRANAFALMSRERRERFLDELGSIVAAGRFTLVAVVIDKRALQPPPPSANPYHLALLLGLERVARLLAERGQEERRTHVVVEARGKREVTELELEFRRVCGGANELGRALPFDLVIADKRANSEGLQLADMVARPVALSVLRPGQPNRAMDILREKIWRDASGQIAEYGLKVIPRQNEGPPGSPSSPSPNG